MIPLLFGATSIRATAAEFGGIAVNRFIANAVNRWHHEQVAHGFARMKEFDDVNGSLRDKAILLYGSNLADLHGHDHENLPLLIAGGGGGTIKPGRQIRYRENTSLSRFHLATLRRMGLEIDEFADSNEPMSVLDI